MAEENQEQQQQEERAAQPISFTWAERAGLIIMARGADVKGLAKIRAATRTLDMLEGGSYEAKEDGAEEPVKHFWADLNDTQAIFGKSRSSSVLELSKEMLDFLLDDVLGQMTIRGLLARRVGPAIDKLQSFRQGTYKLPEQDVN